MSYFILGCEISAIITKNIVCFFPLALSVFACKNVSKGASYNNKKIYFILRYTPLSPASLLLAGVPMCKELKRGGKSAQDERRRGVNNLRFKYARLRIPMKFTLPSLPYEYGALEPYIDAQTMEIHHTKHHQAYINNLIAALEKCPEFQPTSAESLLIDLSAVPSDIRTAVRNNGGGHFNHSLFWKIMKPTSHKASYFAKASSDTSKVMKNAAGEPNGLVAQEIKKVFGSFIEFQDLFNAQAKAVFGSGWAWLSVDKNGKLVITGLPNQDSPLSYGETPIMGLDVWEHAYYLKYQNKRPDYISAWWHVINWEMVEENYRAVIE